MIIIGDSVEELELERKKYWDKVKNSRRKSIIVVTVIFILFCVFNIIYFVNDYTSIYKYLLIGVFIYIVLILILQKSISNFDTESYNEAYKKHIVIPVLDEVFDDLEMVSEKGFEEEQIKNIGIIEMGTDFKSEGYYKAKYRDITFETAKIETEHTYHTSDGLETATDFSGLYYIFTVDKSFKSKLKVLSGRKHYDTKQPDYVEMDNPELNKKFAIFTEDKQFAYSILKPKLIEKLNILIDNPDNIEVNLCIIENQIHLALYNYESNLYNYYPWLVKDEKKPWIDEKMKEEKDKIREKIKIITKVIDYIKENENWS